MRFLDFLAASGLLGVFLILLGIVALFVPSYLWTNETFIQSLRAFGNILISTGLLAGFFHIFLRRTMLKTVNEELQKIVNADAARIGVQAIYLNRAELERRFPVGEFLHTAKSDVLIVAIGATRIACHYQQILQNLLDRGIKVRVLVQSSSIVGENGLDSNPIVDQLARDSKRRPEAFRTEIDTPVSYIQNLKLSEGSARSGSLTILRHVWVPTCSVMIVDGETRDGAVLVELHPFGCETSCRPSFLLESRKSSDSLYSVFVRLYNQLWHEATSANSTVMKESL